MDNQQKEKLKAMMEYYSTLLKLSESSECGSFIFGYSDSYSGYSDYSDSYYSDD